MDVGKPPDTLLRSIQPYLTIYKQFAERDPIVAYFALQHAVGASVDKSQGDAAVLAYLSSLMDILESMKMTLKGEESMQDGTIGAAHVEDVGLKIFNHADQQDRSGKFNKSLIKAFFTSFHMFSIAKGLGEVDEEIAAKRKYAMWKAVEIDRCLKNGIPPTPGPPGEEILEGDPTELAKPTPKPRTVPPELSPSMYPPQPVGTSVYPPQPVGTSVYPPQPVGTSVYPPRPVGTSAYPPQPVGPSVYPPQPVGTSVYPPQPVGTSPSPQQGAEMVSAAGLPMAVISEAKKKCKFASSALDYDDVAGAIEFLTEAIELLNK